MNFHVFPIENDGIFQPVMLVVNLRGSATLRLQVVDDFSPKLCTHLVLLGFQDPRTTVDVGWL